MTTTPKRPAHRPTLDPDHKQVRKNVFLTDPEWERLAELGKTPGQAIRSLLQAERPRP